MDATTRYCSTDPEVMDVLAWLRNYRESIGCVIERMPFAESREWRFDSATSALGHSSGNFFRIQGYRGDPLQGPSIVQPLIDQPETGTQGFIVRHVGADYELLVQARTEPGNVGIVQIGPTIQATWSNYTAVHQGKRQPFLERFHDPAHFGSHVIVDTVQPELGSKFLKKWNRNIVLESPDMAGFSDPMFKWVSLRALTRLMQIDHIVNNDARLVVGLLALARGVQLFDSCSTTAGDAVLRSFTAGGGTSFRNTDEIRLWLQQQRPQKRLEVRESPLNALEGWRIEADRIGRTDGRCFSVIQVRVHAPDREVTDWDQPLIASTRPGRVLLVCRADHGVLNFLFHAENLIGNARGAELQPTACFDNDGKPGPHAAVERLISDDNVIATYRFEGSEEGGRFFQYRNRFEVRWVPSIPDFSLPDDYCWLTLGQLSELVRRTDYVSDESRSVISLFLSAVYADQAGAVHRSAAA